jgi:hypothetical protein
MSEFVLNASLLADVADVYDGPTEFVGLVYSLGYGENEVPCIRL